MVKIITFLGADGSGKSTLLNNLFHELKINMNGTKVEVIHFKPSLRKKNVSGIILPYDKNPHNFIISLFKLLVWYTEYIFFFGFKFIKSFSNDQIIIFDRHLLDIKCDPLRYRMNKYLCKFPFYSVVFPKPNIIFYIYAKAETVNKRKNEVTLSDTQSQLKNYRNELKNIKNVVFVNSEETIAGCNELIISKVREIVNY